MRRRLSKYLMILLSVLPAGNALAEKPYGLSNLENLCASGDAGACSAVEKLKNPVPIEKLPRRRHGDKTPEEFIRDMKLSKKSASEYLGIIYPDAKNLSNYKIIGAYNNLNSCLKAVNKAARNGSYECAKNCDKSTSPMVCEETVGNEK